MSRAAAPSATMALCVVSLACGTSSTDSGTPFAGAAAGAPAGMTAMGGAGAANVAGMGGVGMSGGGAGGGGVGGSTAAAGMGGGGVAGAGGAGAGAGAAGASGTAGAAGAAGGAAFAWPDGKLAAVTLTYDDGLDAHLAHVIPLLDTHSIKATFFLASFAGVDHDWALPNLNSPFSERHNAWAAAATSGHELAAHTVNHPCTTAVNPGQSGGFRLDEDYDMARITGELDESMQRLMRLGAAAPFTFGYPCYSDRLGVGPGQGQTVEVLGMQLPQGESYTAEVATRFLAARGSDLGVADPMTIDLHSVSHVVAGPAQEGDTAPTLAELTAVVDMAIAQGGWVVFLMHGVAGDTLPTNCSNGLTYAPETCVINYLDTPTDVHDGLIDYLAQKEAMVWTTTLREAGQHIATTR